MNYFLRIVGVVLLMSGFALAQSGDSQETLLEQERARAREQAQNVIPAIPHSFPLMEEVTHPLFIGVDDVTVPAYVGDLASNWLQAFVGAEVWGAAYDVGNNKVYFNDGSTLYEWLVGTTTVNLLGTITDTSGATYTMVALAFYNGVLYGARNIAPEGVFAINTTTYVATMFIDYVDADYDFGGLSVDPTTGEFYGTSDDTSPIGAGLYRINLDGTATLIAPYPDSQTDIDGLAVSHDGFAYLVIDQAGSIYVYDFVGAAYVTPLTNPWVSSEVFCGGAWIYEDGGSAGFFPEVLYYTFDEAGWDSTENFADPGSGFEWAQLIGAMSIADTGQFGSAIVGTGASSSTDYVTTGWVMDIGTGDWTISCWLDIFDESALHYIFGETDVAFRCFYGGIAPAGGVVLRGGGLTDVPVTGLIPGPAVVHFVYDSSVPEVRTYVNGVFQSAVAQVAPDLTSTSDIFKVASRGTSTGLAAGELMDEFRFYNRALDAVEISDTWNISIVPVELTSFTASVNDNDVTLSWETATELNNSGFEIERKSVNGEYDKIGFVPGYGTTTERRVYSFSDANLLAGNYTYRLKQIDYDGTFDYSDAVEVEIVIPDVYSLHQNYPNPFNPNTNITFTLAANAQVTLKVFDILGQEVMTLINQDITAGVHTYDFDASGINSGVYFYRIEANGIDGTNFTSVKKMILLK